MNGVLRIQTHTFATDGEPVRGAPVRFDPAKPSRLSTTASRRIAAGRPVRAWAIVAALVVGTLIGGAISFAAVQSSPPAETDLVTPAR